jgi:hypothetical protein
MRHRSRRSARLVSLLGATIVYLGTMAAMGPLDTDGATAPYASSARTFSLDENGDLRLTSKQGFTLNERGSASGTITGTIYVHLSIVSTSRVKAEVSIYPKQGSITGYATASYVKGATKANFSGSISISRGSGSYSHVHGSGLSFSGTIARSNDAVTVHVGGQVAD